MLTFRQRPQGADQRDLRILTDARQAGATGVAAVAPAITLPARAEPVLRRLPLFAVLAFGLFIFTYVPARTGDTYLSDDFYMYMSTKQFGETGKLYFENDLTHLDEENLMHPRGFVTHEGRAVPYSFLGLPVIYGAFYAVIGDYTEYVGAALGALALLAIWGILGMVLPREQRWAFPLVFFAVPLLYYLGRPYMNVVPELAFLLSGVYLLLRHLQKPSPLRMASASALFALAIFCRYPDILLITPLVGALLWHLHGSPLRRGFLRDGAIYLGVVALLFGVPLLVLNQLTYGSPLIYGYNLFNEAYYPDRAGIDADGVAGFLNNLGLMLLPGGFEPKAMAQSLWRYLFKMMPVLFGFAAMGYLLLLQKRPIPLKTIVLLSAAAGYVLLYTGSAPVRGTAEPVPLVSHTLARYWILIYAAMALLAAYLVSAMRSDLLRLTFCVTALAVSFYPLFRDENSLPHVARLVDEAETRIDERVLPWTEETAVIFAGKSDKFIANHRQVAAWHNSEEESFFDPVLVARSMARLHSLSIPAYIVLDPDVDLAALGENLAAYGLALTTIQADLLAKVITQPPPPELYL